MVCCGSKITAPRAQGITVVYIHKEGVRQHCLTENDDSCSPTRCGKQLGGLPHGPLAVPSIYCTGHTAPTHSWLQQWMALLVSLQHPGSSQRAAPPLPAFQGLLLCLLRFLLAAQNCPLCLSTVASSAFRPQYCCPSSLHRKGRASAV